MSNYNPAGGGLQYRGTRADAPPNVTFNATDPTVYDSNNVSLGDWWLNTVAENIFVLVALKYTSSSKRIQATWVKVAGPAVGDVISLSGNDMVKVFGDVTGNVNVVGTDPINVTGNPGTNTETITIATATNTGQLGATTLAPNTDTIAGVSTTEANTPAGLTAKLGVQTLDAMPYSQGATSAFGWTNAGTDGQVIIAATGAAPAFASITSSTLTITPGPNTLNIEIGGGTSFTVTTNNATPTALATFAIPTNQGITLIAEIIGAKSDYSAAIGGEATATARRAGGALAMVGSPIIDLNTDSGGAPDFNVVVSGNNLILQVTGEVATTYNWKALVRTVTV